MRVFCILVICRCWRGRDEIAHRSPFCDTLGIVSDQVLEVFFRGDKREGLFFVEIGYTMTRL